MRLREIGVWSEGQHDLGVYAQSNEDYHASDGVSKSGLWKLWSKSPFHFRYEERVYKPQFAIGQAAHVAILEPEKFEASYVPADVTRRSGKEWDRAVMEAHATGREALTRDMYDSALYMRDAAARCRHLQVMLRDAVIETSGFARDAVTGQVVRCKPDAYSPAQRVIVDLKTTTDANPDTIWRAMLNYGYHVQEAIYTDVWQDAGGGAVDAFVFFFVEKSKPHLIQPYELPPSFVEEGRAIASLAMKRYAECLKRDEWPAYGDEVRPVDMPAFAYKVTQPPKPGDDDPDAVRQEIEALAAEIDEFGEEG